MTSEVEEWPRLVTASYGRLGSQWVLKVVSQVIFVTAASEYIAQQNLSQSCDVRR